MAFLSLVVDQNQKNLQDLVIILRLLAKTKLKNINCITVSFGERVEHPFSEIHQYLGQRLRLLLKDPPFLI